MLTNILKTFDITKTDFFNLIDFKMINKYGKGGLVQSLIVLGPPYHLASRKFLLIGNF